MRKLARSAFSALAALALGCLAVLALTALFVGIRAGRPTEMWRLEGIYTSDPELGYFHIPHSHQEWTDAHGNHEQASINALGLRGAEVVEAKSKPRALLIGDSMVYGHGVTDADSMAHQLTLQMDRAGHPLEVINGGVRGFGVEQEYKLLTRLLRLRPDYVIWFLSPDDFIPINYVELTLYDYDSRTDQVTPRPDGPWIYYRSTLLYSWLKKRLPGPLFQAIVSPLWHGTNKIYGQLDAKRSRGLTLKLKFRKFTESLRDLSKTNGFKALVVIAPDHDKLSDLSSLGEYCALPILDLNRDRTIRSEWEKLFQVDDPHLSPLGHQRVAKLLGEWIRSAPEPK
jgi:hypothetical protein